MNTKQHQIVISLPLEVIAKLKEEASRLGLTPEELIIAIMRASAKRAISEKEAGK